MAEMKRGMMDIMIDGPPGGRSLPLFHADGSESHPYLADRPEVGPCQFSQAEDSMQASGSERPMPGTARPRVRIRENRPGFLLVDDH